jgi:hypothetical protein
MSTSTNGMLGFDYSTNAIYGTGSIQYPGSVTPTSTVPTGTGSSR